MNPVTVYVWTVKHPDLSYEHVEAVVADQPAISASVSRRNDPNAHAAPLLVDAWNRAHPDDRRTYDDFTWQTPPTDWVNPNTEPIPPTR